MLRGVLLWLRFRHLSGRTVGVECNGSGLLGLQRVTVSAFGITGASAGGDEHFVPWGRARTLRWGPKFDALVAARAAGDDDGDAGGDGHDGIGDLYRAFMRSRMAGGEPEQEPEEEPEPAISPDEVERILAEERSAPC